MTAHMHTGRLGRAAIAALAVAAAVATAPAALADIGSAVGRVGAKAVTLPGGGLQLFARSTAGELLTVGFRPTGPLGEWGAWTGLHQQISGQPSAVVGAGGLVSVFALNPAGHLITDWQESADGPFDHSGDLGSGFAGDPLPVAAADGTMAVFLRGADGNLWTTRQSVPDGGWSAPALVAGGVGIVGTPSAVVDGAGVVSLFAARPDGHLLTVWQDAAGAPLSNVADLGTGFAPDAGTASILNGDGTMSVFLRGSGDILVTVGQTVPGGGWSAPTPVRDAVTVSGTPAAVRRADGSVGVLALRDGRLMGAWQAMPHGAFDTYYEGRGDIDYSGDLVVPGSPDNNVTLYVHGADGQLHGAFGVALPDRPGWTGTSVPPAPGGLA
ncbi:hypothetical protein F0L68_35885 [Solihabitans fulvus]|uniref:PLL-like beta propeller domain-containing protein n=1 Tax=Solihabitans fulvus TaxID=1892852 RepID=A0A5B2WN77_9PSEU|nr:hypothetical protein [Solihabitans fulvus]KAA2252424.1 hypothetical protein F0L68_35885 [Solihabitans fulvus]